MYNTKEKNSMAKVIKKGEPYCYYDFKCPKCHSIVRFGESELHEYEDCYDTPMVETDTRCPNCNGPFINVPKQELKKHLVVANNKKEPVAETNVVELSPNRLGFWKWLLNRR